MLPEEGGGEGGGDSARLLATPSSPEKGRGWWRRTLPWSLLSLYLVAAALGCWVALLHSRVARLEEEAAARAGAGAWQGAGPERRRGADDPPWAGAASAAQQRSVDQGGKCTTGRVSVVVPDQY